ncbi:MAG: ABC transporter permease [Acidimicrobiia bacterium]
MGFRFWIRWSWRDLRRRAPQVLAIATIIALGAGVYAGLGTTSVWRRASLDATFSRLSAHDVRVSLVNGLAIDRVTLVAAIEGAAGHDIARVKSRVVAFAPVTATRGSTVIPAAGEIVGVDLKDGPHVDRWRVTAGRDLTAADTDVALLDAHFAREHDLPDTGTIKIGNLEVRYVGLALSPAYLNLNTTSGEAIQGQATRSVLFVPQTLARKIIDVREPRVSDAVIRLRGGVDAERTATELQRALATSLPGVALTTTARRDEPAVRALYDEISSEQQLFDLFALLILAGAGFAAFNLTKRVVEAQRRDIGIAMSLGLPPRKIAIRTMLLAAEITVVGVALGVAAGWAIATWVLSVMRDRVPLPIWKTPFQSGLFLRGALLGLVVPLVASAIPVWRAVRVQPVDALLPPHLRGGGHRLARLLRRLRLPGTITMQTPLRRIVRAPARSALTIAAIAFIMAPLLAALGATDSARATIDSGERSLTGRAGDRLLVDLTDYQPPTSALVADIERLPLVQRVEPGLNTGGYLRRGHTTIGISLSMGDLRSALSVPTSIAAQHLPPGGIVISKKAADDLGVAVGDRVRLRHPLRVGSGFRFADTELPITAIHTSPYRFVAYMDLDDEKIMGLEDIVNTLKVLPRRGAPMSGLQQRIAAMPGVASALPASSLSRTMRNLLSVVGNLFIILQVVIAGLAFLVAFNASNIGAEERSREHATMLAFGIKVRRVAFMSFAESLLLGIVGVGLGLGLGVAVLRWILEGVFPAAVPDLAVLEFLSTPSYLLTVAIGLAAAAAAPWLNVRRLRTMNLPSTLRYVE